MKRACDGQGRPEASESDPSLEDLILIYRTAHSTEAGADPFRDAAIMHLKDPFEAYLARHPERVKALEDQPRIVSDPEEASVAFDVIVVPADPAQNIEAVVKRWQTKFLLHEVPHYKIIAGQVLPLSPDNFNERKKVILLVLLSFEIRYLRGSKITWVGGPGQGQGSSTGRGSLARSPPSRAGKAPRQAAREPPQIPPTGRRQQSVKSSRSACRPASPT